LKSTLALFDADRAVRDVGVLCGPAMAGRLAGTAGEALAAEYLVAELEACGLTVSRERFEVLLPDLVGSPELSVGARRFEHLVDFAVNVQGAAAGGDASGETLWLGAAEGDIPSDIAGRVGVCLAPADLQAFVDRHARIRDRGGIGVLQVGSRPDRRKVMNHLRERPGLPSLDVSGAVATALFGVARPDPVGRIGAPVVLRVPLEDRAAESAGNLVARADREPPRVVLCAHYDHVGALADGRYFPGAGDNACGVAAVLEAARVLAARPPERGGVVVLFAAAEELGMLGSRRFAERVPETATVVNVDDLCGGDADPLWVLRSAGFPRDCLDDAVGAPLRFGPLPAHGFADHVPFLDRGVRRVAALLRPATGSDVAHTLLDTPEAVTPSCLAAAGRALLMVSCRA
jgi:aminopeptidase YwaD